MSAREGKVPPLVLSAGREAATGRGEGGWGPRGASPGTWQIFNNKVTGILNQLPWGAWLALSVEYGLLVLGS